MGIFFANGYIFVNIPKKKTNGGNPEITALSKIFKSPIEVYRDSEIPSVFLSENFEGNTNPTIRIYYANSHYSSVRSDGLGDQLFNFHAIQPGELEKQKAFLGKAQHIQNAIVSEQDPSADEKNLGEALKQSKAIHEAFKNYLRFYAARIIRRKLPKKNIL